MEIVFRSDIGQKRSSNQDFAGAFENQGGIPLLILADGMGGHQAGDLASRSTVEDIGRLWQATDLREEESTASWLVQTIQEENRVIYNKGQEHMTTTGMGTTIVACGVFDKSYTIAHVGDSRAYLVREGQLTQLTEDHSLVNELVRQGEITKEMAAVHPRRNVLTRSVGMPGDVEVDVTEIPAEAGDILLIASDGLTNMVPEADILTVLQNGQSLTHRAEELVKRANDQGGVDNITVLLCERGGHEA